MVVVDFGLGFVWLCTCVIYISYDSYALYMDVMYGCDIWIYMDALQKLLEKAPLILIGVLASIG